MANKTDKKDKELRTVEREYKTKPEARTTWRNDIQQVVNLFYETFKPRGLSSNFIRRTVILFCTRLPEGYPLEAMQLACSRITAEEFDRTDIAILTDKAEQCIKYFCGICWSKIRENQLQSVIVEDGE